MKVVFVCTGNTCRSPMMAAMFRDYAKKVGFDCEVDSAGMTGGGSPVNPKAAHSLAARGLSADDRLSRVFGEGEKDADFVFTMTDVQRDELRTRHPDLFVESLSLFAGGDIADPYGGTQADYDATADTFEGILGKVHDFMLLHSSQK